jgi:hypothetical protein
VVMRRHLHQRNLHLPTPASGSGLGTLVLPAGAGSINFNLIVPIPNGARVDVLESENGPPTAVICPGVPGLKSMVL